MPRRREPLDTRPLEPWERRLFWALVVGLAVAIAIGCVVDWSQ